MNHYKVEGYALMVNDPEYSKEDMAIGFIPLWAKSIQERPIPANPNRPINAHEWYSDGPYPWGSNNLFPPTRRTKTLYLYRNRKHLIDCALIDHAVMNGFEGNESNPNIKLTWRSSKDRWNSYFKIDDSSTQYPVKLFELEGNLLPGKHYAIRAKLIVDVEFIEPPLFKSDGITYISFKNPDEFYHSDPSDF